MRVLLVVDHPYSGALTHALVASARKGLEAAGHEVDLVDLHADGFDPVMHSEDLAAWRHGETPNQQVADYQQRLQVADHVVMAFPIWWSVMPAMTKGFIDKVFVKGVAYHQPKPGGMMKRALEKLNGVTVISVMATPEAAYRMILGSPLIKMLFRGTFRQIGIKNLTWLNHSNPMAKTPEQRAEMLNRVEERMAKL